MNKAPLFIRLGNTNLEPKIRKDPRPTKKTHKKRKKKK